MSATRSACPIHCGILILLKVSTRGRMDANDWIRLDTQPWSQRRYPRSGATVYVTDGEGVGQAAFRGNVKARHWTMLDKNLQGAPVAWCPLP